MFFPMWSSFFRLSSCSVDAVAQGFMELLQDEEKVGEVMRITVKNGIDYHKFSDEPVPM